MMKRILHVVSLMNRGGQETLIMNLYRNIDLSSLQFDFLCTISRKADYDEEILNQGGKIWYLPDNKIRFKGLKNFESIYRLSAFFKSHAEYEIVHFHNYHAFSAFLQVAGAKLGGVKHVVLHSHNSSAPHAWLHKMFRPLLTCFNINRFACSALAARWMFANRADHVRILYNGIELEQFKYDPFVRKKSRADLNIGDEKVICHIGRLNYQKNHLFLLDVFSQVHKKDKDTLLLLVGEGNLREAISERIEELGLRESVRLLGIRKDIPDILSAGDLFVLPSLFEGLSVVLIEAQANGIPCVVADHLAKEGIVADNVFSLSLDRPKEIWAERIVQVLNNEKHRSNIELLKEKGFDITLVSRWLTDYYLNL